MICYAYFNTDRLSSHFGRFAPQIRPFGCAICRGYVLSLKGIYYDIKEIIFETKEHEKVDENKFYKIQS